MKCPYMVNCEIVTQTAFEYDDEQLNTSSTAAERQKQSPIDCIKEQCAAWKSNECQYKGSDSG